MTESSPKPKRGNCGTCSWFEPFPANMQPVAGRGNIPIGLKIPLQGVCQFNPPQPVPSFQQVPGSQFTAQGPQQAPTAMGLRPPVHELLRCSQWRPVGTDPPFYDTLRPGLKTPKEEPLGQTTQ